MKRMSAFVTALMLMVFPTAAAFGQSGDGQVIVVHGVPGLAVDIYVNGDLTFENSTFGDVFGPLALPAGDYEVEIYATGADPDTDSPALSGSATLPAGAVATIAAYLEVGGSATLGAFVENSSSTAAGDARVTARHLADFGAVDILANDGAVFEGVTNGQGAAIDVPAGTYNIKITAAGDPATVAFEADVPLAAGTNTIAYAVGSVAEGTFAVATALLSGLAEAPTGVPTGDAGLSGSPNLLAPIALGALAVAAIGGTMVLARRRP